MFFTHSFFSCSLALYIFPKPLLIFLVQAEIWESSTSCSDLSSFISEIFRMSVDEAHLRHCMLYEFKKGSSASEAARNICNVYGNKALSVRKCQRWFTQFRSGNLNLRDSPRSGRPASISNQALLNVIEENPKLTAREIAQQLNTTHTTIITHLHEIGKVSKLGQWVTYNITGSQLR